MPCHKVNESKRVILAITEPDFVHEATEPYNVIILHITLMDERGADAEGLTVEHENNN